MNYTQLSLDQAPPIEVPIRFLLTAPWFGVAAGLLLLLFGPGSIESRWNPELLGITHLFTLGVISMIMCGALFQLLPVLAGVTVPQADTVSRWVHGILVAGILCLATGLAWQSKFTLILAIPLLGLTFLVFMVAIGLALIRVKQRHPSVKAMRYAIVALFIAVTVGLMLAMGHAWPGQGFSRAMTPMHVLWGLLGWVGLLVMSVAYQVVPMFQMTADYPSLMTRWLVPGLLSLLLGWTLVMLLEQVFAMPLAGLARVIEVVITVALSWFSLTTLWLQHHRRRRLPDVTLAYWRLGMISLLLCTLLWLVMQLQPALATGFKLDLLLGAFFVLGFSTSVISGMLYKIVPFLVWLHLHRSLQIRGSALGGIPNMKQIIPERQARMQYRVQLIAVLIMCLALEWPGWLVYAAGILFILAWGMLGRNLWQGYSIYRRFKLSA